MMLSFKTRIISSSSSLITRRLVVSRALSSASSSTTSHIKGASQAGKGPIGQDGRHEIWRQGIYDHDNEPK